MAFRRRSAGARKSYATRRPARRVQRASYGRGRKSTYRSGRSTGGQTIKLVIQHAVDPASSAASIGMKAAPGPRKSQF